MILKMIVTLSLEDEQGNVIKKQDYGQAYMHDIDMEKAAEDWWKITLYNRDSYNQFKKKKYLRHCHDVYKIVDIFANKVKKTILNKFLCNREDIEKEYRRRKESK